MKLWTIISTIGLFAVPALADDTMVSIMGNACESFSGDQSKSTIRVRVTDKANYNAVSQIEALSDMRSKMLEHDFNVVVYNLVDNYVEDLMVKTVSQNDDELCVEITGSIPTNDIENVIANYSAETPAPEYDFKTAAGIEEIALNELTPKEPKKAEVAEPDADILYQATPEEEAEIDAYNSENEVPIVAGEEKGRIYVNPVEFYNDTKSDRSADALRELFEDSDTLEVTKNSQTAIYTLSPKVLKAKVEPLNAKTKRLQMVVSIELTSPVSEISVTEHQNRFVLFEEGETEQEVAQNLLKKLLQKAGENLYKRMDQMERKRRDIAPSSIITPA